MGERVRLCFPQEGMETLPAASLSWLLILASAPWSLCRTLGLLEHRSKPRARPACPGPPPWPDDAVGRPWTGSGCPIFPRAPSLRAIPFSLPRAPSFRHVLCPLPCSWLFGCLAFTPNWTISAARCLPSATRGSSLCLYERSLQRPHPSCCLQIRSHFSLSFWPPLASCLAVCHLHKPSCQVQPAHRPAAASVTSPLF